MSFVSKCMSLYRKTIPVAKWTEVQHSDHMVTEHISVFFVGPRMFLSISSRYLVFYWTGGRTDLPAFWNPVRFLALFDIFGIPSDRRVIRCVLPTLALKCPSNLWAIKPCRFNRHLWSLSQLVLYSSRFYLSCGAHLHILRSSLIHFKLSDKYTSK
jgi:hypothetical protein